MKIKIVVFIVLVSIVVGWFLIGDNLNAKFGMIDDHEVVMYLGGKPRISLIEAVNILKGTEFSTFGKSARFRPVYFLLRVSETYLWGSNSFLWYLTRFIFFVLSFSLMWILLKRYVGWVIGFLVIMSSLMFTFWTDIWTRLGPSEIYAVPAMAMFLWGYINLIDGKKKEILNWILVLLGTIVAMGSKENYFFIIPLILFLDVFLIIKKRLGKFGAMISLLSMTFVIYIMLGVGLYIVKTGVDGYQNNIGLGSRLFSVFEHLNVVLIKLYPYDLVGLIIFLAGIIWLVSLILKLKNKEKIKLIVELMWIGWAGLISSMILVSQLYFYNGMWPVYMRYDFPGMLMIPLMLVVFYRFMQVFFEVFRIKIVSNYWKYGYGLILVLVIVFVGYKPIIMASNLNVTNTNKFSDKTLLIRNDLKNNSKQVVFESCKPMDIEPVLSISRYLKTSFNQRGMFLRIGLQNKQLDNNDLDKYLMSSLIKTSINGDGFFKPLDSLDKKSDCYSINFSCSEILCKEGVNLF